MKLPANYFQGLTAKRYKEYLKLLPNLKTENIKVITNLIFTFAAMSFFGIFAINPTLSTIVELKKQLADSEFVHQQLTTKINNLSALQQKYSTINVDIPVIFDAIPQSAQVATLTGQAMAVAKDSNVKLISFRISEVLLAGKTSPSTKTNRVGQPQIKAVQAGEADSYSFFLQAGGSYENLMTFATTLSKMNRIVNIDSMSIGKDEDETDLRLDLKGKIFFKQ